MTDLVHNTAKGRFAELVNRVNANDPADSAIVVCVWNSDDSSTDDQIRDADSVAAIEALTGVTELASDGWERKILDNTAGMTVTVDDTNNRVEVDVPDLTWTGVTDGEATHLGFGYDPDSTGGDDSAIIPGTWHDFPITPDGSDVTAQIGADGFFWST